MPSERIQRQIDRFLDEADQAMAHSDWARVQDRAENVLALDPENADAQTYLAAAQRRLADRPTPSVAERDLAPSVPSPQASPLFTTNERGR
ncbi:MAG: hypothetical protein HYY02_12150 [Chloroflexi bacterium]|nr:hypothetical protein [Chloroflexota bacterium]